jgi:hypothetical protein
VDKNAMMKPEPPLGIAFLYSRFGGNDQKYTSAHMVRKILPEVNRGNFPA